MSHLDVALASFWQIARLWQQGEAAKIEMSCEAWSLNIQLNAKFGHSDLLHFLNHSAPPCKRKSPSQLRRQERRRHAAKINVEEAKCTQNLSAEEVAPSKEGEKPKASLLEHENLQYSSDISPMIHTEKPSQLFKFDHCDFVNVESSLRHYMSITHKPFQCEYCNFSNKFHHEDAHSKKPQKHPLYTHNIFPLQIISQKNFDFAHSPYDPKFSKSLLRSEGFIHTANTIFLLWKLWQIIRPRITRILTHVVYVSSISFQRSQGARISL